MRVASIGHVVFAATLIALGIMGLVTGGFTAIWPPVPHWVPARHVLAYVCALVCLLPGLGLIWPRTAPVAARVLFGFLLGWLLVLDLPALVRDPSMDLAWAAGKTATMVSAAWVLYLWFAGERDRPRLGFIAGATGLALARSFCGLALIVFGIAHFTYLARTVSMVPAWLPWHLAWAYFFGCTFIAAGVALITGVYARLAAVLSVVQLAMFTVLVWVPVVVSGPSPSDWSEFVVSWALTAAVWVVADSYRGASWVQRGFIAAGGSGT
jgi:uncharacterized membrane protein